MKTFLMSALLTAMMLSGCGVVIPIKRSESKLAMVSLGETRSEVIAKMGRPSMKSAETKDDKKMLIDEYSLYPKRVPYINAIIGPIMLTLPWWLPFPDQSNEYYFTYVDDVLVKWDRQIKADSPTVFIPSQQQHFQAPQPMSYKETLDMISPRRTTCVSSYNSGSAIQPGYYTTSCQ